MPPRKGAMVGMDLISGGAAQGILEIEVGGGGIWLMMASTELGGADNCVITINDATRINSGSTDLTLACQFGPAGATIASTVRSGYQTGAAPGEGAFFFNSVNLDIPYSIFVPAGKFVTLEARVQATAHSCSVTFEEL